MIRRFLAAGALALAFLAVQAAGTEAGGWATVTLEQPIGEPKAGAMLTVSFVVKQHDTTPIHEAFGQPVTPVFIARGGEDGETVEFRARPIKPIGAFAVDVTFPRAGTWSAEIVPAPFAGTRLGTVIVRTPAGLRLGARPTGATAADEASIGQTEPARAQARAERGSMRGTVAAVALLALVVLVVGALLFTGRSRPLRLDGR